MCPVNPLRRPHVLVSQSAVDYAAFVNVYHIDRLLTDHLQDARSRIVKWIFILLRYLIRCSRRYCEDLCQYDGFITALDSVFSDINRQEQEKESFDDITNAFGHILELIAGGYTLSDVKEEQAYLQIMLFNLGKWLYFADALDEYQNDVRKKSFNLLMTICIPKEGDTVDHYLQKSVLLLYMMQKKMLDTFSMI